LEDDVLLVEADPSLNLTGRVREVKEIDIDDVPWKDEIVIALPIIDNGDLLLPTGPGWGADVNEDVVRAHPPRR
jgi:L-alanine-DL-glutamate epimerase-like enolase superfamily enzyme